MKLLSKSSTADGELPKKKEPGYIDAHLIIIGKKLTDIEINHDQKKCQSNNFHN